MNHQNNQLPMGTRITSTIDFGSAGKVSGWISGLSTVEVPTLGYGYVVCLDKPIEGYDYTHIVIFDAHFEVQS